MAPDTNSIEIRRIAEALERRRGGLAEERRKNLIALAVAFAALSAIVAFAIRPAAILPVGDAALESSLEGEFGDGALYGDSDRRDPVCNRSGDDGFICAITTFSPDSAESTAPAERRAYEVEVGTLGCWTAVERRSDAPPIDGCISILDYFGY
jgi:hypothetical protein